MTGHHTHVAPADESGIHVATCSCGYVAGGFIHGRMARREIDLHARMARHRELVDRMATS